MAGRQVVGGPALVAPRVGHQQDQLAIAGGQLGADPAQQAREERVAEQPAGRLGDDHRDRVAAPGDEAAGGAVGDVAEPFDGGLDVDPDVGTDPRRAVDDARDGRPGDAREMGDLFQRRAGAPGRPLGWATSTPTSVRALSRLLTHSIRRCQESALTLDSVAFRRRRGVRSGVGRCSSRCRRERGGAMRHYGDGATVRPRGSPIMTTAATLERYEAVIGIEVHCQLRTASKMFCGCSTDYDGAPPNTPRLPGLPRPAGRAPDDQPRGGRARPDDRRRDRGDGARRRPAGIARTTSTRTCPRATRSASTTCRSPRSAA